MTLAILKVDEIRADPNQPRKYFKKAALASLARSIELVGQRTPIEVRRLPELECSAGGAGKSGAIEPRFEIIDGERRWRAHKLAGLATIKATIEEAELTDRQRHLLSTISNFHREGHTHIEISDAVNYQREQGATVTELADNLARSETWVYQYLMLQRLAPILKDRMHPETDNDQLIRFSEAIVLASMDHDRQRETYKSGLNMDQGSRLPYYRKRAAELQGKERGGRVTRPSERAVTLERAIEKMAKQIDAVLDLKASDFAKMLAQADRKRVDAMIRQLEGLNGNIGQMITALQASSR